jgi:RNA polymerase sigma-70 factor (ECF subfamily)
MTGDLLALKRIREGDIRQFEAVFRLYYAPLCLYAAGITGRRDAAEEIVQELFYVLWKERARLQILRSLRSYLYGSVRNRALQYCEHREVVERHRASVLSAPSGESDPDPDPQDILESRELEQLIRRTLDRLPERRRRIFRMHRFEGQTYAQIAAALALSVKTIEAEMTKALQTFRKEIEHYIRNL